MLAFLVVSGYDRHLALKIRKVGRSGKSEEFEDNEQPSTHVSGIKIKKVKASRVGNYLVITLVLSERGSGDKVSVEDPALLLPLIHASSINEERESY